MPDRAANSPERERSRLSSRFDEIAEKILARGGASLPALKGNHPLAHAAVVAHFDQHCFHCDAPSHVDCDAFDDTHGRLIRRRVFASTEAATLDALGGWPGLRTVLAVETIRHVKGTSQVDREARDLLSSCPDDPAVLDKAIRSHWAVENTLHWCWKGCFASPGRCCSRPGG